MAHINIIFLIFNLLAWAVVIYLVYRNYRQLEKPLRIWQVAVVVWVGTLSFNFQFQVADTLLHLPVIPLGVFFLFVVLKGSQKGWKAYRSLAWLGFKTNFIFLAAALLAIPIHAFIYPKDDPSTYLADVENAYVVPIHPSSNNQSLNMEQLKQQVTRMKRSIDVHHDHWFDTYYGSDERFPYQLMGTRSKWGSGLAPVIYVEQNGQGLLMVTPNRSYYFRAQASFMEKGDAP